MKGILPNIIFYFTAPFV